MSTSRLPIVAGAAAEQKPPAEQNALAHRDLRRGPWWQQIPAYKTVGETAFLDHAWQARNSITKVAKLVETIQDMVPQGFVLDLESGTTQAPISVPATPYTLPLITSQHPYT